MDGMSATKLLDAPAATDQTSLLFLLSGLLFRMGLALLTFEQDRFWTIPLSDYFFFLCLLLLPFSSIRLWKSLKSGVSAGGVLILLGGFLSLLNASRMSDAAGPLIRLFVLFALFAPLAVVHSKDIRGNARFLLAGISANCAIAMVQAWVFPGIVDLLSINPVEQTDYGTSIGRFIGLTSHPNVLGLSAALGIFLGIGLFFFENRGSVRWGLAPQVAVCAVGGLLSGSRTSLVALVPALLIFGIFQRQNRRAILRALLALGVVWGALTYLAPGALSQYSDRIDSQGLIDYDRLLTATAAISDISQKPLLGWGADHFGDAGRMLLTDIDEVAGAHVTFLQYWYAVGLLGALGFLALFIIPSVRMLRKLRGNLDAGPRNRLSLGLGVYALLFVVSNVQPILYNRFLYVPLFLFAGYAAQVLSPVEISKKVPRRAGQLTVATAQATPRSA
jgi:O-antigen ligase